MKKKIIITGATGLIGSHLSKTLISKDYELIVFTRKIKNGESRVSPAVNYIEWNYRDPADWQDYFDNCYGVIHLAGASLAGKRFTKSYKKRIMDSRIISTKNIVKAISSVKNKPSVFICASGVNFYGNMGNNNLTEEASPGNDFLANVCKKWEEEASKAEDFGIRRVSVRTSPVLSTEGGVLQPLLPLFRFYLGASLGDGRQWFPWIHIDDIINIYILVLENETIHGAINAASPDSVTMNQFADKLGEVLHRPSIFKVPKFVLKSIVGEAADFITASMKVIPKKLDDTGFRFKFPDLETALNDVIINKK